MFPLEGIRVLDLSRVVAGPVIGRIFSDLGADVVKVEPPDEDMTRLWGEVRHGISGFFQQQNAGKRNVCLDFRNPSGVDVLKALVGEADVLIENYRAGVMDRLGIGWPILSAIRPQLVMCSISGFGQTGPESRRQAFASVIQSESGFVQRHASLDARPPTDPIVSVADYNAGLHGAIGILAALRAASATGVGTHLDLAMFDAMMFTDDYAHHAIDGSPIVRLGGEYWQLGDGSFVEVAGQFKFVWSKLADLGVADPTPPGASLEEKIAARRSAAAAWFRSFAGLEELQPVLEQADFPWAHFNTPTQALDSPTAKHRGTVASVDDRGGGTRGVVQSPYRYSSYDSGVRGGAAHRGEHNHEVLADWLGWDHERVAAMAEAGGLRSGTSAPDRG